MRSPVPRVRLLQRSSRRLAEEADAALLVRRLEELGLCGVTRVRVHTNRTVLASVTRGGVLRVHRGFAYASDRVLRAVVRFANPVTTRRARKLAEREIVAFPVEAYVEPRNGGPGRRGPSGRDGRGGRHARRLAELHRMLNQAHFGSALSRIRFRVSSRMQTRLGEITLDPRTGRPAEIAVSREHIERDGWWEVRQTLLHEMVHQWQAESGLPLDHGAAFRRKAREVGVTPRARRDVLPEQPAMLEG